MVEENLLTPRPSHTTFFLLSCYTKTWYLKSPHPGHITGRHPAVQGHQIEGVNRLWHALSQPSLPTAKVCNHQGVWSGGVERKREEIETIFTNENRTEYYKTDFHVYR